MNRNIQPFMRRIAARASRCSFWLGGLVLCGCSMAPGMHAPARQGAPPMTTITPALVAEQQASGDTQTGQLAAAFQQQGQDYRVGPADVLAIGVVHHPELVPPDASPTSDRRDQPFGFVVDASGQFQYPYVGNVAAAGKTLGEIRAALTRQLAEYIRAPQVAVRVIGFRSKRIYVDGAVRNAGSQNLSDVPMTLATALAGAGGIPSSGDASQITIAHDGWIYPVSLPALERASLGPQDIYLHDQDRVHVAERTDNPVYVAGEVGQPRAVPMHDGVLSLGEALASSGSVSQVASNPRGVYVVRLRAGETVPSVYRLDASSPTGLVLAGRFALQPHDLVYVQTAALMRWNRVMDLLLSSTLSLYNTHRVVDGP